jgi:hypothetical protein
MKKDAFCFPFFQPPIYRIPDPAFQRERGRPRTKERKQPCGKAESEPRGEGKPSLPYVRVTVVVWVTLGKGYFAHIISAYNAFTHVEI